MTRITQSVVAARAGVSGATVSRAIHGDPSVLPETREHVLNICRQLGYKPSIAARHLSQGGKAVVGLSLGVRDHAESRYVSLMHQALSAELAASSWSVRMISRADFNDKLDIGRRASDLNGADALGHAVHPRNRWFDLSADQEFLRRRSERRSGPRDGRRAALADAVIAGLSRDGARAERRQAL